MSEARRYDQNVLQIKSSNFSSLTEINTLTSCRIAKNMLFSYIYEKLEGSTTQAIMVYLVSSKWWQSGGREHNHSSKCKKECW